MRHHTPYNSSMIMSHPTPHLHTLLTVGAKLPLPTLAALLILTAPTILLLAAPSSPPSPAALSVVRRAPLPPSDAEWL